MPEDRIHLRESCFGYVYLIQSGLFNEIVHALEIATMGRDRLYAAFQEVYDFSPAFRGYGIGYVTRYISIMTEAGVGVFGTHNFGGMHNDIVTMYIELKSLLLRLIYLA